MKALPLLLILGLLVVVGLHALPFNPPTSTVKGTAVFSANTGAITGLDVDGCITGVTYNTVGQYSVSLSGCPANYKVFFSAGDSSNVPIMQIDPAASYTSTGFSMGAFGNGGNIWYDPALVFISVQGHD